MTISELSDSALSEWIAEKIEPKPTAPPRWSHEESTLKAWTSSFKGKWTKVTYPPNCEGYSDPVYEWQFRNFAGDPACTVMLLERLREYWLTLTISCRGVKACVRTQRIPLGRQGSRHVRVYAEGERLGRVVAEISALSMGWKP